jgi:hypothetical protein
MTATIPYKKTAAMKILYEFRYFLKKPAMSGRPPASVCSVFSVTSSSIGRLLKMENAMPGTIEFRQANKDKGMKADFNLARR